MKPSQPYTLFVPVYNEEDILEQNMLRLLAHCESLGRDFEIILGSNGSTDASLDIGQQLQSKHPAVKFLSVPKKGVGRAFKEGIKAARYDWILFMDADLSADLSFIEKALILLEGHELVLGAKIKGLQNRGLVRKIGSVIFYFSVLAIMRLRYVDYAPGAKGYRKEFLLEHFDYIDDHTSFVLNLTYLAYVEKKGIVEIPIACQDSRRSRFNLLREAGSKYWGLISLKIKNLFGRL